MYKELCDKQSDINEHLSVLAALSKECKHITEMGVRYCVSTWAFIEGMDGGKLIGIDIRHPSSYSYHKGRETFAKVLETCKEKGIEYQFIEKSTLEIEIEPTDMLFIDTLHTYQQLSMELELHSDKARKYIILHDTESCKNELQPAVDKLLSKGKWRIHKHYSNNNGLTILCL